MEPTFAPAGHADLELLLAMRREFCRHQGIPMDEVPARAALLRLLGDPSLGRMWLVVCEGRCVGYAVLAFGYSLEFDGRDAFLDELFISESHRGRGLGQQTLRFVESQCAALDVRALHLEVGRDNTQAQAVYLKAGFEDRSNFLLSKRIAPSPQ